MKEIILDGFLVDARCSGYICKCGGVAIRKENIFNIVTCDKCGASYFLKPFQFLAERIKPCQLTNSDASCAEK